MLVYQRVISMFTIINYHWYDAYHSSWATNDGYIKTKWYEWFILSIYGSLNLYFFFEIIDSWCILHAFPWVNYNISLTWIVRPFGWFPSLTMIPVRENSEVVIIYPVNFLLKPGNHCPNTGPLDPPGSAPPCSAATSHVPMPCSTNSARSAPARNTRSERGLVNS